MIDIETFDTANTAVVFQVGLILFDSATGRCVVEQLWHLDVAEQINRGRTINANTLHFWLDPKISSVAYSSLSSKTHHVSTSDFFAQLYYEIQDCNDNKGCVVYAKGSFDFNILEDMYDGNYSQPPWKFYQCRDLRTLMKECGVPKQDVVTHNALDDCKHQVKQLMKCRKVIKG